MEEFFVKNSSFLFAIIVILLIFFTLLLLTAETSIKYKLEKIISAISIPLAIFAIISSLTSFYFIHKELQRPILRPDLQFYQLTENQLKKIKGNLINKLGGYFNLTVINEGTENARSVFISGFVVEAKSRTHIANISEDIIVVEKNSQKTIELKFIEPKIIYHGLINISCRNCEEVTRWKFLINSNLKETLIQNISLDKGILIEFDPW